MQGGLLCTDADRWSFHVCIRRKVVISFAFVRAAPSIPAASPQQWEWDHLRFRQAPENHQVLEALSNQLHTAENCSCVWGGSSEGWDHSTCVLKALQKSTVSLTQHKWMVISALQGRYLWLHFTSFSLRLFSVNEQSLQWENLLCGCARSFSIWIMEKIAWEAVRFQICPGACMWHIS